MNSRCSALVTGLLLATFTACSGPGGDGGTVLPLPDSASPTDGSSADVSSDLSGTPDGLSGDSGLDMGGPGPEVGPADIATDPGADTGPDIPDVGKDTGPDVLPPPPGIVDPNCVDGQYTETLPPGVSVDISGFISNYDGVSYRDLIDDVLEARYPLGAALVTGGVENATFGDCIDFFISNTGSASSVIGQLGTVTHECGHFYDIAISPAGGATYVVTESLTLECFGASYQGSNKTFPRSYIRNDAFSLAHPPCAPGEFGGCDHYADVYLNGDGDPSTGDFDSGDQGFDMVLEETVQYVNSLATGYAFIDQYTSNVSERDGLLTFLWYVQRYLNYGRLNDTASYEVLASSPCWRNAILTIWGRAWLYLQATADMPLLGIEHDKLYGLATDPVLLQEIQLIRERHGCQ